MNLTQLLMNQLMSKNTITSNMVSNNVINTVSPRPIPAYIVANPSL